MRPASVNLLLGEAISIDGLPRILPGIEARNLRDEWTARVDPQVVENCVCLCHWYPWPWAMYPRVAGVVPDVGQHCHGQGHAQRLTVPRIHARVCVERMRADERHREWVAAVHVQHCAQQVEGLGGVIVAHR